MGTTRRLGNGIRTTGFRTYTVKRINGKCAQILLSWSHRRCQRCQRFLSKQQEKWCTKCAEKVEKEQLKCREDKKLRDFVLYHADEFNIGEIF